MERRWFKLLLLLFFFVFLILLVEGVYYWRLTKKPPASEITPQLYSGEMVATERIEVFLSPGERNVGYFVPGQKFTPTGEQEGNWIQIIDSDGYQLWIEKDEPYQPTGE